MLNSSCKPQAHYMGPIISTDLYISLEIQRWILHNETPGRFGVFGTNEVAA